MTTDQRDEGAGKPKARKAAQRRVASQSTTGKPGKERDKGAGRSKAKAAQRRVASQSAAGTPGKERDVSMTTTSAVSAGASATGSGGGDKDFFDLLGGILPDVATTVAPSLGIDPRVAGQTVSQVLSIFGIGGPGKAFTATVPKEQAVTQLKQVVSPYLSDPAFKTALAKWIQLAVEPVQAQKEGKAYQPSVDLSKGWFDDAVDWVGDQVSNINWNQVAQVGMQALPYVAALL
jgi:hypothetical protein